MLTPDDLFPASLPAPREADLDRLFFGAIQFRLFSDGVLGGEPSSGQVLLDCAGLEDLRRLRQLLRFGRTGFHCMCLGSLALEISGVEGRKAVLGLHHGISFRWDGVWHSDATLADPRGLADFFAERGCALIRNELHENERQAQESRERRQRWWAAAPRGMPSLEELGYQGGPIPPEGKARARQALKDGYPVRADAVRALLHWHAHGLGPWNTFAGYEELVEDLLEDYPLAELLQVLHSEPLTRTEMEGAARLLAGWRFWKGREAQKQNVSLELRHTLAAAVADSGQSGNVKTFANIWREKT